MAGHVDKTPGLGLKITGNNGISDVLFSFLTWKRYFDNINNKYDDFILVWKQLNHKTQLFMIFQLILHFQLQIIQKYLNIMRNSNIFRRTDNIPYLILSILQRQTTI